MNLWSKLFNPGSKRDSSRVAGGDSNPTPSPPPKTSESERLPVPSVSAVPVATDSKLEPLRTTRTIEQLIGALEKSETSNAAADALVDAGTAAVPPLIAAIKDGTHCLRKEVANVLGRIGDVRAIEPLAATLKQYDQTNPKPTKTELRDLLNVPKFGSQNQENDWVRGELETMYATDAAKAIQEAIHRIESHAPSPGTSVSERLPVPTQPQLQPTPAPPKAATPVTGKCDICTQVINRSDGYVLTTRQVVTEMAYWLHVLKNQGKSFRVGDLKTEMQLINGFAMEQAASATGWLVCEQCSSMFKFDRVVARQCAVSGEQPPGAGPADARDVMTKAVYARTMLEG